LLKFTDNDFFQISTTFGILNRIAGPVELAPPICRTQGEFLLVRNSLLVATVIGLGRLFCANRKNPCLPEVMGFFDRDEFVSAARNHYVSLARSMRPELFFSNETHYRAKAISEFERRKTDLMLHWADLMKSRQVSSIVKLRHTRYAHSDLNKATGKRVEIPDLKFDDLKKVINETKASLPRSQ
jgi:glutaredoxin-related protein